MVHVVEVATGKVDAWRGSGRITSLAFAARGETLIALGHELTAFDVKTGMVRASVSAGSSGQSHFAVTPDDLIVAGVLSVSANESFKVPEAWTIDGDKFTQVKGRFTEAMGHRTFIDAVAISPDGSILAASSGLSIRLWDMKRNRPIGGKLSGHMTSIAHLRFSPDGRWLASCSWDGTARIWEIPSGRQRLILDADVYRVTCVDWLPDGSLAAANWDGTVHVWKVER